MIVILNGPPGSGKDEAASLFKEVFGFGNLSFKYQLFKETINHFEVDKDWFMEGYDDREVKEKKEFALKEMSRREAMIHVSEDIVKPKNGKDYFGRMVAEEIEDGKSYAIADGGFIEELEPIIEKLGEENIVLVQITREGHDFSTDSRRYFDGKLFKEYTIGHETPIEKSFVLDEKFDIKTYRIHNNGSLRNFHNTLMDIHSELKLQYDLSTEEPTDA